jgi:hypothetical protein
MGPPFSGTLPDALRPCDNPNARSCLVFAAGSSWLGVITEGSDLVVARRQSNGLLFSNFDAPISKRDRRAPYGPRIAAISGPTRCVAADRSRLLYLPRETFQNPDRQAPSPALVISHAPGARPCSRPSSELALEQVLGSSGEPEVAPEKGDVRCQTNQKPSARAWLRDAAVERFRVRSAGRSSRPRHTPAISRRGAKRPTGYSLTPKIGYLSGASGGAGWPNSGRDRHSAA